MTLMPLNTVWFQTHWEGSNCIDVKTNSSLIAALQTTSHIFGRTSKSECITLFIMQRLIAFSDEMKAKEAFQPFTEKLTARAGSMRALQYTASGPEMVPCARTSDTSSLRLALTFYGSLPQLTPKFNKMTPYDNQSDVVVIIKVIYW